MLFLLLAPFAFAPVAVGRWLLLAAPLLAEVVFMQPWNYEASRVGSHYTAPLLAAAAIAAAFGSARYLGFSKAMIGCALVVMLLDFQRYGAAAGSVAVRCRLESLRCGDRGPRRPAAFDRTAARRRRCLGGGSGESRIRLDPRPDPAYRPCPAYNTNARAFFASLAGRLPQHLCGGVPVQQSWRCHRPVRAMREDRGRFAALRDARVLIYWPHGLGDWVHFGAIAPLLEAIERVRHHSLW